MSYKALYVSIALALVWTGVALWALRPASPTPLRFYVVNAGAGSYQIQAHETRYRDACTVFIRDGQEIACVCGTHTWSEAVEADGPTQKGMVF